MFESKSIPHPSEAPSWLDSWPGIDAISQRYTPALRRMAYHLTTRLDGLSLEWTDTVMKARMGGVLCTWNRTAEGAWNHRCTCGAPPAQCTHVYLSCLMLDHVFRTEGWLGNEAASRSAGASAGTAGGVHAVPAALRQPSQTNRGRVDTSRSIFADDQRIMHEHQLEVEVDFKHEPPKVTLRFYDRHNGMRQFMRLNELYGIGYQLRNRSLLSGWSQKDMDFLQWLYPYVAKIPWQNRNLEVLKLAADEFERWQSHWVADTTRFLERESQEFLIPSSLDVPVDLTLELKEEGDSVQFLAAFVLPGGAAVPVHDFYSQLRSNPALAKVKQEMPKFASPIPLPVLEQFFSEHPPKAKRAQVPVFLKKLVNGRLDIVRGDFVKTQKTAGGKTEIYAGVADGAFYLEGRVNGAVVELDTALIPNAEVSDDGSQLLITMPDGKVYERVRRILADLPFEVARENRRVSFAQTPANAIALKRFWQGLPNDIEMRFSDKLSQLLGKHAAVLPVLTVQPDGPLVNLGIAWSVGGQQISHGALLRQIRSGETAFRGAGGNWLDIDPEAARKALEAVGGLDSIHDGGGTVLMQHAKETIEKLQAEMGAQLTTETRNFVSKVSKMPPPEFPPLSRRMRETLRPYQLVGAEFLLDRAACNVGAILADDMGLGKTLQVLAVLEAWHEDARKGGRGFQALVVCPASVMQVWLQQARQFCPGLSAEIIHGTAEQRSRQIAKSTASLLITHYQLARMDKESLQQRSYDFLILDEAQAIKNPQAQVTQAVTSLKASHAIAMSGTPVENAMTDLWSIMNCINPGFLGELETFQGQYNPANHGLEALRRKIRPLILRRSKQMVAQELPPRTEQVITMAMTEEQQQLYDALLASGKMNLDGQSRFTILGLLTRLREVCCHPRLVYKNRPDCPSIKLERLGEQLLTLNHSGHSTLIFSQFTSMLELIADKLRELGLPFKTLTGETPLTQRQRLVQEFQDNPEPENFLLSLKAAGTGLTLTKADYVFIFDPWWNPAVEQQAIDRTHRIGQTNPVVAYKYVTEGTIEEKILLLLQQKRELFNALLESPETAEGEAAAPSRLSLEDLRSLLR